MAEKFTRLSHKIAIQLHLAAESCTICSSRSRWPIRKPLDTPSYYHLPLWCRVLSKSWGPRMVISVFIKSCHWTPSNFTP